MDYLDSCGIGNEKLLEFQANANPTRGFEDIECHNAIKQHFNVIEK